MLHEIFPLVFHNEYIHSFPDSDDYILDYQDVCVLAQDNPNFVLPRFQDWKSWRNNLNTIRLIYAFRIVNSINPEQEQRFFLALKDAGENISPPGSWSFIPCRKLRYSFPISLVFAMTVGLHLYTWYSANRYCGKCGHLLTAGTIERNLICPHCHFVEYPRISPCIIVAVKDGERLLLTRYPRLEAEYALVAGFIEIGETPEQCVEREVMEETGIKIKNIQYVASQPWGFSGSLCMGFTAELDGSDKITVDRKELAEALWIHRKDIPAPSKTRGSITGKLISRFIRGEF